MCRRTLARVVSALFFACAFFSVAGYTARAEPICNPSEREGPDKKKNWYKRAQSIAGSCCCGDYDGIREGSTNPPYGTFVEWDIKDGHYRVFMAPPYPSSDEKPQWYVVPDDAIVKQQDHSVATPPPFAEVWTGKWSKVDGKRTPYFRCLHPGAGT